MDVEKIIKMGKDLGLEPQSEALRTWVEKQLIDHDRRREAELEQAKIQKETNVLRNEGIQRELELHRLRAENPISHENLNDSIGSASSSNVRARAKLPSLPVFDDTRDKIEHWLTRFERYFDANRFEADMKAVVLSAYLRGAALEVYNRLSVDDSNNYNLLKSALLRKYEVTSESCRREFRRIALKEGETYNDVRVKLETCLSRWLKLDGSTESFEGLRDLIIRDQLLEVFPQDLKIHVKELGLKSSAEYVATADRYRDAHKIDKSDRRENSHKFDRKDKSRAMANGLGEAGPLKNSSHSSGQSGRNAKAHKKCDFCKTTGSHDTVECFRKKRHENQSK